MEKKHNEWKQKFPFIWRLNTLLKKNFNGLKILQWNLNFYAKFSKKWNMKILNNLKRFFLKSGLKALINSILRYIIFLTQQKYLL